MKKKKKRPSDELIKSVLEDLKSETDEPSIKKEEQASVMGKALFSDYTSRNANEYDSGTGTGAPEGLLQDPSNDKTTLLGQSSEESSSPVSYTPPEDISEKTVVACQRALPEEKVEVKTSFGIQKQNLKSSAFEAQFIQAENLKIAQQRIIELEKDIEKLRKENELLSSAGDMAKQKTEELEQRVHSLDRARHELKETNESELKIFRDGLNAKDMEISRLRTKVDELESRLANDLRKIRVRERELENRLELSKLEKGALIRSKDETILELKRKLDLMTVEVENYQNKILELNQKLDSNQEQFSRTVRALRIALTNLEVSENTSSITLAPLKKAE